MSIKPFPSHKKITWITAALVLLFGLGLAVRVYDLTDPPLDFQPTRQLHSLIIARGMYLEGRADVPAWQRELAVAEWHAEGLTEPPLMERLVSLTYALVRQTSLWVGRVYSILFWMLGGVAIYLLARRFFAPTPALIALGIFLLLPFGIIASRSFQPDPLMTALIAWSWLAACAWLERRSWASAFFLGALMGLAVLVKATAAFFVYPAFAGALLAERGLKAGLRDPQAWAAGLVSCLPYGVYFLAAGGGLQDQLALRFFPSYWIDPAFYLRWLGQIEEVLRLSGWITAMLGAVLLTSRRLRGLVWGGWIGYVGLGLALSHHISTHNYYSLPLIALTALGLASIADLALKGWAQSTRAPYQVLAGLVLLAAAALTAWGVRTTLKKADFRSEPAFWSGLGARIGRDSTVTILDPDYGLALEYWGWILPSNWYTQDEIDLRKSAGESIQFSNLFADKAGGSAYFLVTALDELERQPELKAALSQYVLVENSPNYLLYDLRKKKP